MWVRRTRVCVLRGVASLATDVVGDMRPVYSVSGSCCFVVCVCARVGLCLGACRVRCLSVCVSAFGSVSRAVAVFPSNCACVAASVCNSIAVCFDGAVCWARSARFAAVSVTVRQQWLLKSGCVSVPHHVELLGVASWRRGPPTLCWQCSVSLSPPHARLHSASRYFIACRSAVMDVFHHVLARAASGRRLGLYYLCRCVVTCATVNVLLAC
jgi:hypothetical protein